MIFISTPPGAPSAACSFSTAVRVSTTLVVSMTSRAVMRELGRKATPGRLRTDSASFSSGWTSTSSALPSTPSADSIAAAARVLTSPSDSASTMTSAPSWAFWASAAPRPASSTFFGAVNA